VGIKRLAGRVCPASGWVVIPQLARQLRRNQCRFYLEAKGTPSWLNTAEALGQIGGRKAFHEFVLSGNEESLERYYKAERQSPILGSSQWGPL